MLGVLIDRYGDPVKVLVLRNLAEPTLPGPGEVLVGVEYAPVDMSDLYVIHSIFAVRPDLPGVVGNKGVGHVMRGGKVLLEINRAR